MQLEKPRFRIDQDREPDVVWAMAMPGGFGPIVAVFEIDGLNVSETNVRKALVTLGVRDGTMRAVGRAGTMPQGGCLALEQ